MIFVAPEVVRVHQHQPSRNPFKRLTFELICLFFLLLRVFQWQQWATSQLMSTHDSNPSEVRESILCETAPLTPSNLPLRIGSQHHVGLVNSKSPKESQNPTKITRVLLKNQDFCFGVLNPLIFNLGDKCEFDIV